MRIRRVAQKCLVLAALSIAVLTGLPSPARAAAPTAIIVRLKPGAVPAVLQNWSKAPTVQKIIRRSRPLIARLGIFVLDLQQSAAVAKVLPLLQKLPFIHRAMPDHTVEMRDIVPLPPLQPNDAGFFKQWSLLNPTGDGGIGAGDAWRLGTGGPAADGTEFVTAIVDSGVDGAHPDLAANLFTNAAEIAGNGIDDDDNGYVDDVQGLPGSTLDETGHGTMVAGIVGARGDNQAGVAGINWRTRLMPVRVKLTPQASEIFKAYEYLITQKKLWQQTDGKRGANIIVQNSSFGHVGNCATTYKMWNDVMDEMGKVGILSIGATANQHYDVDADPDQGDLPTSCESDYLISVTDTDQHNALSNAAAYGAKSIDLGAPGEAILSTAPDNKYRLQSGTSFAAPHVTGAIALMYSVASARFLQLARTDPAFAAREARRLLLESVDELPSLKGLTVTGGRLNLFKATTAIAEY